MTPPPLADLLHRLRALPEASDRWQLMATEAIAHGGIIILSTQSSWGPHETMVSIHGVFASHADRDAALGEWIKAAERTVAALDFVLLAEHRLGLIDQTEEQLDEAAEVVLAFSQDEVAREMAILHKAKAREIAA